MRGRGFTLMELMISMAILAVIATMAYGSFRPTWLAKEEVDIQAERYHAIRMAMSRMSREISMAFLSNHYDRNRYRERPTHFVGRRQGDRDVLRFTTFAHERLYADAKESDQAVVEYRVDRDPDDPTVTALIRRHKTVIDDRPDDGGAEMVLVPEVTGLRFEYWDPTQQEWVDDWDTEDVAYANRLPERVRITLRAPGDDGQPRDYTTQTMIMLRSPLGR